MPQYVVQVIESYQAEAYRRLGWAPPGPGELEETLLEATQLGSATFRDPAKVLEYQTQIRRLAGSLSPYEDPVAYWHLMALADDIEEGAKRLPFTLPERPVLATLPGGEVNAATHSLPGLSPRLVFFDSGIYWFAWIMANAVARSMPVRRNQAGQAYIDLGLGSAREIGDRLASGEETREAVFKAVLAYATTPNARGLLPLLMEAATASDIARPLSSGLVESACYFILGHEYGHIILNHGDYLEAGPEASQREATRQNWQMEQDADMYGTVLSTAAMSATGGHGMELAYVGGDFFFSCMELVERAVSLLRHGDEEHLQSLTHPSPESRRLYQRQLTEANLGEHAESLTVFGRVIEEMLAAVWKSIRPQIEALRDGGFEPSDAWRL
jgi:hypothetical protein